MAPAAGSNPRPTRSGSSTIDPDAALVRHRNKALMLAHKAHLAVDGAGSRIITAVATTAGDYPEHRKLPYLVGQYTFRVRRKPKEVVANASTEPWIPTTSSCIKAFFPPSQDALLGRKP
ncbi:MAG: hypothetical protein H5U03_02685 [Clostridia bacterium]|nr:hypothetical protein [Clostridia bacterium]